MSNSSIINAEESMKNFKKTTAVKRQNIRETLEAFHSQSNSLLLLAFQWKDLEEYFEAVTASIARKEEEIEVKNQEIEWKQKYLNKKTSDIEVKAKTVEESMKMADDRRGKVDEASEIVARLYEEVTEKERFCEEELEYVRCKIERLKKDKRGLKRKYQKKELKLEARELVIDSIEEELESRRKKLNSHERMLLQRIEEVKLREKRFEEMVREFDRGEKVFEWKKVDDGVKVKDEPVDFDNGEDDGGGDGVLVDPSYADLKFNVTMDGIALQMFLNGRVNDHEALRDEIITALGMSVDPAKLVLDAMKGFYPDELGNECVGFDLNVVRKSCVLLLEQLIKMKPRIKTRVRERAMRIAMEWKGKMNVDDADHLLEIVGFLQLLATYGLSSVFSKDVLSSLFESCAICDGSPKLCYNLGLTEHVEDIIQNLIIRRRVFEALRLIYAFGKVIVFPPVPILKTHLMYSFHCAEELNNNGDPSLEIQIKCITMKLSALVSAVKCIQECGLESDYPVQPLEQLISELEMHQKSLVSASKGKSTREVEEPSILHSPISSSVKETNTSMLAFDTFVDESHAAYSELPTLTDSSSAQTQGSSGYKRPRLASVVVPKDVSGETIPDLGVDRQASVYYCLNQSGAHDGIYTLSPYYCYH